LPMAWPVIPASANIMHLELFMSRLYFNQVIPIGRTVFT